MRISDWSSDVCSSDLEIFLMPAELAGEKEGTFTNTHRLVPWHDKVIDGPGDSRSALWFMYHLGKRLKALYADRTKERDQPIRHEIRRASCRERGCHVGVMRVAGGTLKKNRQTQHTN